MRILRYFINTSLVLSLSFSGLRANEEPIDLHSLDRAETAHHSSEYGAIGFGAIGNSISSQRMFQINKKPIETPYHSKKSGAFLHLQSTDTSKYVVESKVCGLAKALKVVSMNSCQQVVMQMQSYHQTIKKIRTYPKQAQFNIAPELQEQLTNVDTSNVANLEGVMDARRVVTSVALGYLAALEVTIDFGSFEAFKAFQAAWEATPGQEVINYRLDRNIPKPKMKGKIVEHGQLVEGVPVPDIWQLVGGVHMLGDDSDRELQFEDISSLIRVLNTWTQAYDTWRGKNQERLQIKRPGVVGLDYSPISDFPCYYNPIQGFRRQDQELSLKSANNLVVQDLKDRVNILLQFVDMIRRNQDNQKEQNILGVIDQHYAFFKSLIKVGLDSGGNNLLHYASFFNLPELIRKLLEMGAGINDRNALGMHPLMIVARNGYLEAFEAVLAASPELELKDHQGWTAFAHAAATSYNVFRNTKERVIFTPLEAIGHEGLDIEPSTVMVTLPYYQCRHVLQCNHSKIKDKLIKKGAKKTRTYFINPVFTILIIVFLVVVCVGLYYLIKKLIV